MDFSMVIPSNILWFGLRSCLYCGSLGREADGLCTDCSEDLWSWQNTSAGLFRQQIHKLEVHTLFQWIPGKQEVLSRLVHALKGPGGRHLWQIYSEEFLRRQIPEAPEAAAKAKPLLIIPSPARTHRQDHAWFFADALAREMGGQVYCCLSRSAAGTTPQKRRSRAQRQKAAFVWAEKFTLEEFQQKSCGLRVVFVDDIVTTGATALAAWKILGKPRDFAVWALAQRSLSCGASRDLL